MKRNIPLLPVLLVCAVCLCACGEQGALPPTTTTTTTTISTTTTATTTAVTTTVATTTTTTKLTTTTAVTTPITYRTLGKTTTAVTTTEPTSAITTTTALQDEQAEFPGVIVKAGIFSYVKSMPRLSATDIVPTEEFLAKYPIPLPSGFATMECRYLLPNRWGLQAGTSEAGEVSCKRESGTSCLDIQVGKTGYPATNLQRPFGAQASYANDIAVTICQNTGDYGFMGVGDFMATFQKEGFYYRLFATDMTLKELVVVLEELMGGEFSKTTRPTTTTTFYTSERTPTTTTVA